jgi:dynein heavy chain 2
LIRICSEDLLISRLAFLETLNSLLSSGEATGVFTNEEIEPLLTPIREMMREEGGYRTPYDFFVSRVKKYLHIILCMDPGHHAFLYRCESNPALYSKCAVIWMGEWRTSTLKVIPTLMEGVKELVGYNVENENDDDDEDHYKHGDGKRGEGKGGEGKSSRNAPISKKKVTKAEGDALIETILSIHSSSAAYGATPKDYIVFLQTWHSLYDTKRAEVLRELGHLEAGLSKLDTATEVVNDLRSNAVTQEKDLRVAQAAADRAMDEISKALAGASDRRQEVGEITRTVADNQSKTPERKREI